MAFLEKHLEVRESQIPGAGSGLYTTIDIPKGTRITEYTGRIRTWKDAQNDHSNYYILYVTKNHVIDGQPFKRSIAKYINDAKGITKIKGLNNNTQFTREGKRIFVDAVKNIPAGSELFVGYGKDYWDVIRSNIKIDKKLAKEKGE